MAFLSTDILGKKIHVVGMTGAEGASIARFLATEGAKHVTLHDFVETGDLRESFDRFHEALTEQERQSQFDELMSLPFEARIGPDAYLDGVEEAELLFLPQSWFRYEQNKVLHELKGKVPFWNITKLYVELAPCTVVGISGTSGKSTTSRLLYEICRRDRTAWFTGNDRLNVQILDKLPEMKPEDVLVVEVSNRQLLFDFDKPFDLAGLTNIIPSHLDDHKDAAGYIEAKKRLFRGQTAEHYAVLNADDEISQRLLPEIPAVQGLFSLQKELEAGAFRKNGELWIRWNGKGYRLADERDVKLPGPHNTANILLASLLAFLLDVD
ncbi:MAG: hypothetical protein KC653_03310, partial [Candidatus Andersenbacteria bacterium]|nr:hypothetical protein [Candidatus Andersenbacteria bacterium]